MKNDLNGGEGKGGEISAKNKGNYRLKIKSKARRGEGKLVGGEGCVEE